MATFKTPALINTIITVVKDIELAAKNAKKLLLSPFPTNPTTPERVTACVIAFIRFAVCGNPIFKGALISTLTGLIATAEAEVILLETELGRLNVLLQIAQLEQETLQAILNKTQAELNLILGPLAGSDCIDIQTLIGKLSGTGTGKFLIAFQNKINDVSRLSLLGQSKLTNITQHNQFISWCKDFINKIDTTCGS